MSFILLILGETAVGAVVDTSPEGTGFATGTFGQGTNGPTNDDAAEEASNFLHCDRTNFRVSRKEGLVDTWDGLKVRQGSWEPRHPQEYVRGVSETLKGSPRPEQTDREIDVTTRGNDPLWTNPSDL